MNLGILKFGVLLLLTALTNPLICAAQSHASAVIQDPKIERLLAEKRKINSSITITDKYKIQLLDVYTKNGDLIFSNLDDIEGNLSL